MQKETKYNSKNQRRNLGELLPKILFSHVNLTL